jgi:hypothetical protein
VGLAPHKGWGWLLVACLTLAAVGVSAQDGGLLGGVGQTQVSLVNPFTGTGITVTVLRLIYVVGGLVLLIAGWSAYRLALSTAGFVVGASLGAALTADYGQSVSLIATIVVGMIGGVVAYYVYLLAVALVGAYVGLLVTNQVVTAFELPTEGAAFLLIYGGGLLVGAVAALALAVELTIILTSAVGAVMLAGGTGLVGTRFAAIWVLLLFIAGVVVQMQFARSRDLNPFRRR